MKIRWSKIEKRNPSEPLRVCVSGSRGYSDLGKIEEILVTVPENAIIVHGGARGVDRQTDIVAHDLGFETEIWPADWKRHGRAAGPIRNREMVESCDHLIAFWDGKSRGTASAIKAASDTGISLDVILAD